MRPLLVLLLVALSGCTVLSDFGGYHHADGGSPDGGRVDGGLDGGRTDGGSPDACATGDQEGCVDAGPRDAGSPDACTMGDGDDCPEPTDGGPDDGGTMSGGLDGGTPPLACAFGEPIDLGTAATSVTVTASLVFDASAGPEGALAFVHRSNAHSETPPAVLYRWTVDLGTSTAVPRQTSALQVPLGISFARVHLAWHGTDWRVLGSAAGRGSLPAARTCTGAASCAGTSTVPSGLRSPLVVAHTDAGHVVVGSRQNSDERMSGWLYASGTDTTARLLLASTNSTGIDLAARAEGEYVALVTDVLGASARGTFAWISPSGVTPGPSLPGIQGPFEITYDTALQRAVGAWTDLDGVHYVSAAAEETAVTELATRRGSLRPLVARGDGTFWTREGDDYVLRAVDDGAMLARTPAGSAPVWRQLVLDGEYALFEVASTRTMQLRVYSCPPPAAP